MSEWDSNSQLSVYLSLSYGSLMYNYTCNQCLSPLKLWVRIPLRHGVLDTILYDKFCQWLPPGQWFSAGTPVSSTNKKLTTLVVIGTGYMCSYTSNYHTITTSIQFLNYYNILPEVHMLPSNFIYSFTVWFIDFNIDCNCSSLGLCITNKTDHPDITEIVFICKY
jgi:hypothetical protein